MMEHAKSETQGRLNRIAGQVRGIARMVDEDRPAAEVLVQLAAAQAAISSTRRLIVRSLVRDRLSAAVGARRPVDRDRQVDELMELVGRYLGVGGR